MSIALYFPFHEIQYSTDAAMSVAARDFRRPANPRLIPVTPGLEFDTLHVGSGAKCLANIKDEDLLIIEGHGQIDFQD